MIHYVVDAREAHAQRLHVTMRFAAHEGTLRLALPAWIPGSYLLREFSRYLSELDVRNEQNERLHAQRQPRGTFALHLPHDHNLTIRYEVTCQELTVRTPHADHTHAFFNGANVFLYDIARQDQPLSVELLLPAGWSSFVNLPRDGERYRAACYDVLADTPFELGPHRSLTFDVGGKSCRYVLWGEEGVPLDTARLERDTRAIIETQAAAFGGLPYDHYDIILHVTPTGRGGLEHLQATTLATPHSFFKDDKGWLDFLGLLSHEHLHVYNGKRVRPVELGPFDYQEENHTYALWVVEGWTSYLDDLFVMRAGCVSEAAYLEVVQQHVRRLAAVPGRFHQSVRDASFDAWTRLYRPDANTPNRTVSYYLKGAVIALALDLSMRLEGVTEGLLAAMQELWRRFLTTGAGYTEAEVFALIDALGAPASAEALQRWTEGVGELDDLPELLRAFGVAWDTTPSGQGYHGLVCRTEGGRVFVQHVLRDGPADMSLLTPGDELLALDGRQVNAEGADASLARYRAGDTVTLTFARRGRLHTTHYEVAPPRMEPTLGWLEALDEDQARRKATWLHGPG